LGRHGDGARNVRQGELPTGMIRHACLAPAQVGIANGPIDAGMAPERGLLHKVGNSLRDGRT